MNNEQAVSYYVNNANLSTSENDFRFYFGEKVYGINEDINCCYVVMSPQQFKAIYKLMTLQLENYENTFGEIKITYEPKLKKDFQGENPDNG